MLQATKTPVVATARTNLEEVKRDILKGLDVDEERLTVLKVDVLGQVVVYLFFLKGFRMCVV